MDPLLHFSPACSGDALLLSGIARASKAHWRYPAEWMEAWLPQLEITGDFITAHTVITAQLGGQTIGFYAIGGEAPLADLLHFWLLPDFIGRGMGKRMFQHALATARAGEI
ncbi:MAG: N-acetyltransferase, partial [Verrucomicrobiaceae bacterium]